MLRSGSDLEVVMEECTLEELSASLKEAGKDLQTALDEMQEASISFLPTISQNLRTLLFASMVDPFLSLMDRDRMNCIFMETAWREFLEGSCFEITGTLLTYKLLVSFQAFLASGVTICLFILWRHFYDTRKLAVAEDKKPKDAGEEDAGEERA
jgi:hypothetical protein